MNATRIMMVAGERSGDVYGGELARTLRARLPELSIFGCGGKAMREAGAETLVDAHELAMAGITEVVRGLPRAWRAMRLLAREAQRRRPALAVLIDFPDFNLRLAKKLRRLGIRVIYFVSPQIWAWRPGRLRQIKERVERMLCIFDFEEKVYREAGVPVEYVGHPLVDRAHPRMTREEFFRQARLDPAVTTIALLPGSRPREVSAHLPIMLEAASQLAGRRPVQFVVAAAPSLDFKWLESLRGDARPGGGRVALVEHATDDALFYSDLAIVASGTATVEAALALRPMVVVYRVSPLTWVAGKFLVKVPFYSMVNLLAGKVVVPELFQSNFTPQKVRNAVENLLDRPDERRAMARELAAVKARLGPGRAIERAADAVIGSLRPADARHTNAVSHQ
jgi:lipid-A-disaccharide synthase